MRNPTFYLFDAIWGTLRWIGKNGETIFIAAIVTFGWAFPHILNMMIRSGDHLGFQDKALWAGAIAAMVISANMVHWICTRNREKANHLRDNDRLPYLQRFYEPKYLSHYSTGLGIGAGIQFVLILIFIAVF